ncbi:hypothetical protein [Bacillus massiliglaciei]|uniref:hypothetical protein n=1 Tax=Bacillus massiliglaciei TaxID=1816693 RepID=UPI002D21C5A7|nr:hypothetical protein [Bacillus massiliglaciei]
MKIRKADQTDAYGIAKVQVDSWQTTYKNIVPDDFLEEMTYEKREPKWKEIILNQEVFVSETNDGEIVGFSNGGKEQVSTLNLRENYMLYIF